MSYAQNIKSVDGETQKPLSLPGRGQSEGQR